LVPSRGGTTAAAQLAGTGTGGGTTQGGVNTSQTYGSLPLPIEPNLGQVPSGTGVQYLSHGPGFGFYLTSDGAATLDLTRPGQDSAPGATVTRDALRISLDGANAAPRLLAQDQQAGRSNYFTGASSGWLANVPQYGHVMEQGAYPGIDAEWGGTSQRQLEQTFVVAPGADPSQIKLHIAGATSLNLDGQGDLQIGTGGGTLLMTAPTLSQAGSGDAKQAVTGSLTLLPGGDVGFQVGSYDSTKALTIDPVLVYSSYLGGSGNDQAAAIAADGSGDIYVTGTTTSSNFPTTTGSYQTTSPGQAAFVTKLNASGTSYVYSTYLSGSHNTDDNNPLGIAVDLSGSVYVAGSTTATDFPTTSGAYQSTAGPSGAAFVSKLSAGGDALLYSTYLGNNSAGANAIAVDSAGSAYVTGQTGSGFPTTSGALQAAFGGGTGTDAFVAKLNASGSALTYSTYLGGSGSDNGNGIAVDGSGNAYVTGKAGWNGNGQPSNFPTTSGGFMTSHAAGTTGFVSKLNAAGSQLLYSTLLGGSASGDVGNAIAVDASGNAYVTGSAASSNFPMTPSGYQTTFGGGSNDAFATKVNPLGNGLIYSTYLGGPASDTGDAIAVDSSGYATVVGSTGGSGFPTTSGAMQTSFGGGTADAFVSRLTADGMGLTYSTYLGGSDVDAALGVAVDFLGNVYAAGYTGSTNFPSRNPIQDSSGGNLDAWVAKVALKPAPPTITGVNGGVAIPGGQVTSSQTPTITGTATAGATVTVSRSDLGVVGTATANGAGAWSFTSTTLPEGTYAFTATATVGGVTSDPSAPFLVAVDLTGPAVTLTAPSSTTSLAPVVEVTASDLNGLPDGTAVAIDVELSTESGFSGTLSGRNETGYATGTLTGGAAFIVLPALPSPSNPTSYKLQARVTDLAGNQGTSSPLATMQVTAVTAWSLTNAVALTADPQAGDSQNQLGNVHLSVPLNLDLSGGSMSGGAALVYNSDSVSVTPTVQATLQSPNNITSFPTITAALTLTYYSASTGTLTYSSGTKTYSTGSVKPGDPIVIAAQAGPVTNVGAYAWSLAGQVGTYTFSCGATTYAVPQDNSALGAGWTFGPVDQLYPTTLGVLRAYGTGEWRFYSGSGSTYTSPPGDVGTLTQAGGTFTYATPDGQRWTFNSAGYETGWSSADGQSLLTYTYTGANLLATITAVDGTTTSFTYPGTDIVTGNNRTTVLSYGTGFRLTQITNPDTSLHTFTYDTNGRVTGETLGNVQNGWAYTSGALSALTWGNGQSPSVTSAIPVAVQGLSAAVRGPATAQQMDSLGDVTTLQLDAQGRPLQRVEADGGVTAWGRNPANGFVTTVTDPLGRTTTYQLDSAGYVTSQVNPDGSTKTFNYQSAFHALVGATDVRNSTTTYAYDSQGHQTSTTDALIKRTTATYLSNGRLQTVTDPNGHTTTYAYDSLRRVTTSTDALNKTTILGYDANGFRQTKQDPLGKTTTTKHDVIGRITQTIDALTGSESDTYDADGLPLTDADPQAKQSKAVFDLYNRGLVLQTILAVGTSAQASGVSSYDAAGRVVQTRDFNGWATAYAYDRAGRKTQTTDPLGGVRLTRYDLAGEAVATRDPLGRWTFSAFNQRGWVTQVTDPLGGLTTYAYDAGGNLVTVTDPLGRSTATVYDALNRPTVVTDALTKAVTTTYDAAGNVSTVTDRRGAVTSLLASARK
jgi:YD repeat-containing protein